jgi:hypothetical protein
MAPKTILLPADPDREMPMRTHVTDARSRSVAIAAADGRGTVFRTTRIGPERVVRKRMI